MRSYFRDFPWKTVPWALVLAGGAAAATCSPVDRGADAPRALISAIERHGLKASPEGVVMLDSPSSFRKARGIVRAWRDGEPADIYMVHAQLTSGAVVGNVILHNLTFTPQADEGQPIVRGTHLAVAIKSGSSTIGVRGIDLSGEGPLDGEWSALARAQNGLTNLQQTGQSKGVRSMFWELSPPTDVTLSFADDTHVELRAGETRCRLPVAGGEPVGSCPFVKFRPTVKARPGNLVTWSVDRVRAFTWFGDNRMQMLKAIAFGVLDVVRRTQSNVMGDHTAEDIAADLGDIATRNPPTNYTDPETGWPPAPMKPFLRKPIEGEGKWILLDNDPFIRTNPGAPPAFATSFIRTDIKRSYTRIYVTLWDPRQVEIHMMAGSVEPKGATGVAGPGLIPRRPELMKRLVAACNGGFQALHGEWGMMAEGIIYLPPKPYSATLAELRDGWTGFGSWPKDPVIPPEILSYRQNLTVLVQDGQINPYKRGWWGGTPPEWEDRVHSTRTGICLTQEDFIAYFYGNEIDVMPIARAMVQARCKYGIHLDMNPGHTGLEFYKVAPTGSLPKFDRPFDKKWEAEGPVVQMDGWSFRGRRMVRFMGLMNFPRYIQREARDFFYLTLRPILPGPDVSSVIESAAGDEGKWRTRGLPQHGFPSALATTTLRAATDRPDAKVFLLKIDPRMVAVVGEAGVESSAPKVVSLSNAGSVPGAETLWKTPQSFIIAKAAPSADAVPLVSGVALDSTAAAGAFAAVGIQDDDGMLVYGEVQSARKAGADAPLLQEMLEKMGCSSTLILGAPLLPAFGDDPPPTGVKGAPLGRVVPLVRRPAPGAKRIFTDTPIVSPDEWGPLQARRIRYFRKPKEESDEKSDESGDEGGATPSEDEGATPSEGASE